MPKHEWPDLVHRLEADPENDVWAAMLTDALIEEREMIRTEADGYVATLRKTARDALDIAHVANVIRANGPQYVYLIERIRRTLGQPTGAAFVLFLIAGDGDPRIGVGIEMMPEDDPGPGLYVVLPCSWARRILGRTGLPLHFPRAPRRVAKAVHIRRPSYRVIEQGRASAAR